jgi:AraC family transcriptional regulator of adaptative response/methylated-DNA-[protein]-cysteine methyltransferase
MAGPRRWVERALAMVRDSEGKIKDSDLKQARIDPAQARRYFQKHYGLTFQAFCRARRNGGCTSRSAKTVSNLDEVALGNGFESHSGFRDAFARTLVVLPGASRDLDRILVAWFESPLGPMVAAANDAGVCLVDFSDRRLLEAQFAGLKKSVLLCDCAG